MVAFDFPLKTVNEANVHEHRFAQASRRRKQREAVALLTKTSPLIREARTWPGWDVLLIRGSAGTMDRHDGLPGSMKAIVDELANQLGLKTDSDQRVRWHYEQNILPRGKFNVRVEIHRREAVA